MTKKEEKRNESEIKSKTRVWVANINDNVKTVGNFSCIFYLTEDEHVTSYKIMYKRKQSTCKD